jgi:hypothetical protein
VLTGRIARIIGAKSKKEYLPAVWGRYQRVGRRFKSKILDEFCAVCGYARKYAIGLLSRKPRQRNKRHNPHCCGCLSTNRNGALAEAMRKKLLQISPARAVNWINCTML